MNDTADRLVETVAQNLINRHSGQGLSMSDIDALARQDVAAVLRVAVALLRAGYMPTASDDYGKGFQSGHGQPCADLEVWVTALDLG